MALDTPPHLLGGASPHFGDILTIVVDWVGDGQSILDSPPTSIRSTGMWQSKHVTRTGSRSPLVNAAQWGRLMMPCLEGTSILTSQTRRRCFILRGQRVTLTGVPCRAFQKLELILVSNERGKQAVLSLVVHNVILTASTLACASQPGRATLQRLLGDYSSASAYSRLLSGGKTSRQ
jgi:hypothetical protein